MIQFPCLCLSSLLLAALASGQQATPHAESQPASQSSILQKRAQKLLKAASEVSKQVEALAGQKFKTKVRSEVHNEKQLVKFLKKKLYDEDLAEGRLEQSQYILRQVGLIPKDMDLGKEMINLLVSQIGGFYDPEQGKFFMMLKSARLGELANRTVMAHELTHALDDQLFDLKRFTEAKDASEDEGFATGAVIEGSATSMMIRWTMAYGREFDSKELLASQKKELEQTLKIFGYPEYFQTVIAKYYLGLNFLAKGKGLLAVMSSGKTGLRANVAHVFGDMPKSSEQILHPRKYWNKDDLDLPVTFVDEKAFTKAQGLSIVGQDTLGELLCGILCKRQKKVSGTSALKMRAQLMAMPRYWIDKGGAGWGGDRVFLVGSDRKKPTGMAWLIWWDRAKDLTEFLTAYKKAGGKGLSYGVASEGKLCVLTYGDLQGREESILAGALVAPVQKGDHPFQVKD